MKITVKHGQTLNGLAVKHGGGMSAVFDVIAMNSGFGLDTVLVAGQEVNVPDVATKAEVYNELFIPKEKALTKIITGEGQTISDLAIQETGSMEGLFAFLKHNGLKLDSKPVAGTELKKNDSLIVNTSVQKYFKIRNIKVNTGGSAVEEDGIFDDTFDDTFN